MFVYFLKFFKRLFIFETGRDRAWTAEGQGEGDTESETGSRLWAVSTEPDVGLELTTVRSWPEPKSDAQLTKPPRRPMFLYFRERERQRKSGRGRERGRHRIQSRLQAPSCQRRAWCGAWTHDREIMTWAEVWCLAEVWSLAIQVPLIKSNLDSLRRHWHSILSL